jgi:hypothetical protein
VCVGIQVMPGKSMIVHINSYPGVGKLTIGRLLAERLGAKLLDNHSMYNVAFALSELNSPAFYETVRAVRNRLLPRAPLARRDACDPHKRVLAGFAVGHRELGGSHRARPEARLPLFVVVLSCSPEENERRIQSPERVGKRKPRNIEMVQSNVNQRPLLDHGGDRLLRLDVTDLSANEAAGQIAGWLTMEQAR